MGRGWAGTAESQSLGGWTAGRASASLRGQGQPPKALEPRDARPWWAPRTAGRGHGSAHTGPGWLNVRVGHVWSSGSAAGARARDGQVPRSPRPEHIALQNEPPLTSAHPLTTWAPLLPAVFLLCQHWLHVKGLEVSDRQAKVARAPLETRGECCTGTVAALETPWGSCGPGQFPTRPQRAGRGEVSRRGWREGGPDQAVVFREGRSWPMAVREAGGGHQAQALCPLVVHRGLHGGV